MRGEKELRPEIIGRGPRSTGYRLGQRLLPTNWYAL